MPPFYYMDVSNCATCPFKAADMTSCTHPLATNATTPLPEDGVPDWCPLIAHATMVRYVQPPAE